MNEQIINELESYLRKIILKLRCQRKKHNLVNQFCKKCGTEMSYDYQISAEDWEKLPAKYQDHVLCIHCFCEEYPDDLADINIKFPGGSMND